MAEKIRPEDILAARYRINAAAIQSDITQTKAAIEKVRKATPNHQLIEGSPIVTNSPPTKNDSATALEKELGEFEKALAELERNYAVALLQLTNRTPINPSPKQYGIFDPQPDIQTKELFQQTDIPGFFPPFKPEPPEEK